MCDCTAEDATELTSATGPLAEPETSESEARLWTACKEFVKVVGLQGVVCGCAERLYGCGRSVGCWHFGQVPHCYKYAAYKAKWLSLFIIYWLITPIWYQQGGVLFSFISISLHITHVWLHVMLFECHIFYLNCITQNFFSFTTLLTVLPGLLYTPCRFVLSSEEDLACQSMHAFVCSMHTITSCSLMLGVISL